MAAIPEPVRARLAAALPKYKEEIASATSTEVDKKHLDLLKNILAEVFGYSKETEITSDETLRGPNCDLAIRADSKVTVLIKAKGIGSELTDDEVKDATAYAVRQKVEWVVLTNAAKWRIYKVISGSPIDQELVGVLDFATLNPKDENHLQLLFLLTKEGWTKLVRGKWSFPKFAAIERATRNFILACAPLILACIFSGLFSFFANRVVPEKTSWRNVDEKATEVLKREAQTRKDAETEREKLVLGQQAVETAREKAVTADTTTGGATAAKNNLAALEKNLVTITARATEAQNAANNAKAAASKLPPSSASAETSARMIWGATGIAFSFLLVLVMIQSVREIEDLSDLKGKKRPWTYTVLAIVLVVIAASLWLWLGRSTAKDTPATAGGNATKELLQAISGECNDLLPRGDAALVGVTNVAQLANFMSTGSIIAIVLVACAVSAIFYQLRAKLAELRALTPEQRGAERATNVVWFQALTGKAYALIQLTALALIAGVLEIFLLYLVASHHVRSTLQADVHQYARAMAISAGTVYTGLLIGIYLPMYDAQKRLDRMLAGPSAETPAPLPSATSMPLTAAPTAVASPLEISPIKSTITLFAPVLAAFGAMLVGFLNQLLSAGTH